MVDEDGMPMLNQAERAAPPVACMVIRDHMKPVMSMTNGKMYDAKSEIRKEYKRAGVVEVGNDVPTKKYEPSASEKAVAREKRKGVMARALSKAGFGAP
jgi:hypothetical protein